MIRDLTGFGWWMWVRRREQGRSHNKIPFAASISRFLRPPSLLTGFKGRPDNIVNSCFLFSALYQSISTTVISRVEHICPRIALLGVGRRDHLAKGESQATCRNGEDARLCVLLQPDRKTRYCKLADIFLLDRALVRRSSCILQRHWHGCRWSKHTKIPRAQTGRQNVSNDYTHAHGETHQFDLKKSMDICFFLAWTWLFSVFEPSIATLSLLVPLRTRSPLKYSKGVVH